jgi:hypothetical protein
VIGTLAVDVVVIARSRLPYVSDIELPASHPVVPDSDHSHPHDIAEHRE